MSLLQQLGSVCEMREPWGEDVVDGVRPQVVARPVSTEETAGLLRRCTEHDLAVTVRGHGSKLSWGRPPARLDVLLETQRMDALVEHAAGDLIATVGAGMPLARLGEVLTEAGQQLVVDDLLEDADVAGRGSTVGGMLATGLAGPRRMWAGSPRDLLIGVTIVRADGTVAKAGGKVVKNVAGYDLGKLVVGSYGTLAVITQATFRLHPVPAAQHWVQAQVPLGRLAAVLEAVVHSQLYAAAVEVDHGGDPSAPARVGVLVNGTADGAQARARATADLLTGALGERPGSHVAVGDIWWPYRLPTHGQQGPAGLLKLTAQLSGIPALVRDCAEHGVAVRGSAGTGVLYGRLPLDGGGDGSGGAEAPARDRTPAVDRLRAVCTDLGGSLVVLDAPAGAKQSLDTWGTVPAVHLMRRVKDEFDPAGILAPGRFVGGI